MLEAARAALAIPGLPVLAAAVALAGMVRGFAGFGTAMVFMPVAGALVSPVWALTMMAVFDLVGPLPLVRRALGDGHPRDVARLGAGAALALPLGVLALGALSAEGFRYAVSGLTLGLLALLLAGWRYRGALTRRMVFGVGGLSGFLAGSTGLSGPPAILFYMASQHPARVIRANLLLYLLLVDVLMIGVFWAGGLLSAVPLLAGALLALPYTLGNMAGAAIFRPEREQVYRRLAYGLICVSALSGLPFW